MIEIIFTKAQAQNERVQRFMQEMRRKRKIYIRLPGESKSGICPFCAQYIFMTHDLSGRVVPLPVVGTHDFCVCSDILLAIFKLGTGEDAKGFSDPAYRYKMRAAKAGKVKRFEWLSYQSRKVQREILGVKKAGFLKRLPASRLYDKTTGWVKPNTELE
jgi:hypothetical protein